MDGRVELHTNPTSPASFPRAETVAEEEEKNNGSFAKAGGSGKGGGAAASPPEEWLRCPDRRT